MALLDTTHAAAVLEPPALDTFDAVAAAARDGLLAARKSLPPWLLYDAAGSALFEEITRLPEYYLTRTERTILTVHAPEIVQAVGPPFDVVELGAGSAAKTRLILDALLDRQPRVRYAPVDVSRAALRDAALGLRDRQAFANSLDSFIARQPKSPP